MVETTLVLASLLTYAVASAYAYVGVHLVRAASGDPGKPRAMMLFGIWWLTTALNQALGSTLYMAAALGWSDVHVQLAYLLVQRLLLAASLVGLMTYLVHVVSGRHAPCVIALGSSTSEAVVRP